MSQTNPEELLDFIVKQLEEKKGIDIISIPVAEKTVLADYFVLASGSSVPQVRALADQVDVEVKKKFDLEAAHIEGYESARWILLDYLDVVVHIFHEEDRSFYSLEKLWSKSPQKARSKSEA